MTIPRRWELEMKKYFRIAKFKRALKRTCFSENALLTKYLIIFN